MPVHSGKKKDVLAKYSKIELIHLIEMFNIDVKMEDLKKKKMDLKKMLIEKGLHKKEGLPTKPSVKKMVESDKKNKQSLISQFLEKK